MLKQATTQKDPPAVIRARELQRPRDFSVVVCDDPSMDEQWDFCFIHEGDSARAFYGGMNWVPLNTKEYPGVHAPNAFGNKTDKFLHHADTILYMRPKHIGDQEKSDQASLAKYILESKYRGLEAEAESIGAKITEHAIEIDEVEDE
jgi:hypothetical protein